MWRRASRGADEEDKGEAEFGRKANDSIDSSDILIGREK